MKSLCFALLGATTSALAAQSPSEANPDFLVRGARVFDGERVLPAADVLVHDGRIAALGPAVEPTPGARVIDGTGKTLLPGFLDAHTHAFADALVQALAFGVTTELDMFTDQRWAATMRREQAEGGADGRADLFSAGTLVTAPKGHGTEYGMAIPTIETPQEADAFVAARVAEGSDWIKIVYDDGHAYGLSMPTLDRLTLQAVIAAAHMKKKLAVVHIGDHEGARTAIECGADALVHLFVDVAPDDGFAKLLADHHAFVIPTLTVLEGVAGMPSGAALVDDPRLAPFLSAQTATNLQAAFPHRPGSTLRFEHALATVRALRAAGVPILAGTDAPNPGTAHGASIHREMELLVQAGLTPTEALAAATSASAKAFGLADRGRIAPGLRADLVLVEGDPTTVVAATRAIVSVWKRGVPVGRDGLRASVTREKVAAEQNAVALRGNDSGGVSDFDDGSTKASFGAGWSVSTDAIAGGKSTGAMQVVDGGADDSAHALEVTGEVDGGLPYAWSGAMFTPGTRIFEPVDLSAKHAIEFWAKGDGATLRVMLFSQARGRMPMQQTFTATGEWQKVTLPFAKFEGYDGKDLTAVLIGAGPKPGKFAFAIDGVRFE